MVIGLLELPYHATSLKAQLPTRPPFTLGDFLRVAVRDRPAKSLKGLSRMTNLCGVSHVQMAKVQRGETVWKLLCTGQPPYHEPRHRHVDEGLSRSAKPLVVFGHPAVVGDPRKRALYDPPSRQDTETPRRHEPLPVHLLALLGPLPGPSLCHLLGHGLLGLAHHLHAQPQNLLCPLLSPPLVACIDPQVRK